MPRRDSTQSPATPGRWPLAAVRPDRGQDHRAVGGYVVQIERAIIALRRRAGDHRAAVLVTATVVFVGLAFFALRSYTRLDLHPDPVFLVAALALAVPTIGLNAAEFALAARVVGQRVSGGQAVTVSVAGSAANLLPIPGAVLVRSTVLVSGGASLGAAAGALASIGVVWVGVTLAAVGAVAFGHSMPLAVGLLACGLTGAVAGLMTAGRRLVRVGERREIVLMIAAVEIAVVATDTARMWLVLRALGVHASAVQSFAMTAASVLATATGVLPGGLGLREALSAAFGAASGLPAGVAVTAAATDRLVVLAVLAAASTALALSSRHRSGRRRRAVGDVVRTSPVEPHG